MRILIVNLIIVALATIISCNPAIRKIDLADTNNIVYGRFDYTPDSENSRSFSINLTKDSLRFYVTDHKSDTVLIKAWPFSEDKFNDILNRFKKLKRKGDRIAEPEMAIRHKGEYIMLLNGAEDLFYGLDYGDLKDFKGADIDLSYLIPDLDSLIESTRSKNKL